LKNTDNNAKIFIVSLQSADGETNSQKFATEGKFYLKNGNYYIVYEEHEEAGMWNTNVFIKVSGETITIRRNGEVKSVMVYEIGKNTEFIYSTPYGNINIKIKTKDIIKELTEDGGIIKLSYSLFTGSGYSDNEIEIKVECKKG